MVRQFIAAAVLGSVCVAQASAPGGPPGTQVDQPAEQPAKPNTQFTVVAMHRVIDLKLDETPLTVAFDRVRDLVPGAPLFVNWKSLEEAGVDRNRIVSLDLRNVHAETALDLLLRIASPEGPRLGWIVDEGVIDVATQAELDKGVIVQVYDIRDLLPKNAPAAEHQRRVNVLMKFLTDRIDPISWKSHGGTVGAMRELQGQLIVTQTPQNHRAMVDLIQGLRQLNGAR